MCLGLRSGKGAQVGFDPAGTGKEPSAVSYSSTKLPSFPFSPSGVTAVSGLGMAFGLCHPSLRNHISSQQGHPKCHLPLWPSPWRELSHKLCTQVQAALPANSRQSSSHTPRFPVRVFPIKKIPSHNGTQGLFSPFSHPLSSDRATSSSSATPGNWSLYLSLSKA